MSWDSDIQEWSNNNGRDAERQKNILKAGVDGKGWNPKKYQPSMKSVLFDYLDKWHTLSLKKMPLPATLRKNPFRRNPGCLHDQIHEEEYLTFVCMGCGILLHNVDLDEYEQY